MNCLECESQGIQRTAVALCHNCSAALCLEHALVLPKHLEVSLPVCKTVTLPIPAQIILCRICHAAMTQPHLPKNVQEQIA